MLLPPPGMLCLCHPLLFHLLLSCCKLKGHILRDSLKTPKTRHSFPDAHSLVPRVCSPSTLPLLIIINWGLRGCSGGEESACSAGDPGLIPDLERSPGEGNGYPLQYSCQENSMGRGAWQAIN